MMTQVNRKAATRRRHTRLRRHLTGSTSRPRLAVYRSGKHIYAQLIDDTQSTTLAYANSLDQEIKAKLKAGANVEAAKLVGALVANRALAKGVQEVVFDRGGNIYHGRISALAEAAREAGLQF